MRRRDFIPATASAASLLLNPAWSAETRRPNVLFVLADQWRPLTLTANLRRLTEAGTTFTRCYATNPAKAPSRASILTGCYPHVRPAERPPLTKQLEAAGYATGSAKVAPFFLLAEIGSGADDALGEYLDAVPGDTLVVFTSDRGNMLGAHGLGGDGWPFEESVRVPLIIRYPGHFRSGEVDDLLMSNADIMPSLLSLCGAEIPATVQGRDLSRTMISGEGERPESVYSYGRIGEPGEWRMLVRGLDKLVVNTKMEATHLYNLGQDPGETRNLATEIGWARNRAELKAHLRAWMKKTGDGLDPSSGLKVR